MRYLFWIFDALLILYIAAVFIPFEPEEQRPGTRLSGELAHDQDPDWTFLEGSNQIFVETQTWYFIRHSVTTTSWVRDGELYVPCGNCEGKRWPKNVAADPDVRLKIQGKIYERRAIKLERKEDIAHALGQDPSQAVRPGLVVYRMEPRA